MLILAMCTYTEEGKALHEGHYYLLLLNMKW